MIADLARWVAVAVIGATGGSGCVLIAASTCSTSYLTRQRGAVLILAACVASVLYAVVTFLL